MGSRSWASPPCFYVSSEAGDVVFRFARDSRGRGEMPRPKVALLLADLYAHNARTAVVVRPRARSALDQATLGCHLPSLACGAANRMRRLPIRGPSVLRCVNHGSGPMIHHHSLRSLRSSVERQQILVEAACVARLICPRRLPRTFVKPADAASFPGLRWLGVPRRPRQRSSSSPVSSRSNTPETGYA
jgi:hypothetical protein